MDRVDEVRRKLELYRKYLAKGAESDLAAIYLREITRLEAELALLQSEAGKRS